MRVQPSRLDGRFDHCLHNGPSRTKGTVKGVTQAKIEYGTENASRARGSAHDSASGVLGL